MKQPTRIHVYLSEQYAPERLRKESRLVREVLTEGGIPRCLRGLTLDGVRAYAPKPAKLNAFERASNYIF